MITKSEGMTPTERLLADLCERSFLKFWSYPNPYKEDGDELCDLLAVFENHVFVFFDRECHVLDEGEKDVVVSWKRWKKKVIDKQVSTAHGAERYIRSGRGIFLDAAKQTPFPVSFDAENVTVHKIIVAHGAKEACLRSSTDNVYGSLAISYGQEYEGFQIPFLIRIDKNAPVHVLDSHNLPIVLGELDTFSDLVLYLEAKTAAIRKLGCLTYCGEEDLLAHYFCNFDENKKAHFIGTKQSDVSMIVVVEGEWRDFVASPAYKRKKQADKVSYLWDELIQRTCQEALDGTLIGNSGFVKGGRNGAVYVMAKEPRFARRALSEAMINAVRDFPDTSHPLTTNITLMSSHYEGTAYVFLQVNIDGMTEPNVGPIRRDLLELACGVAKNRFGYLQTIVGIGISAPKCVKESSEDFLLMDCTDWPDQLRQHYESENERVGFFKSKKPVKQITVKNFP